MKRVLLLLSVIMATIGALAGPVTIEQARQKAQEFMARQRPGFQSNKLKMAQRSATTIEAECPLVNGFYVFNYGSDEGFVVVSADDRTEAILGYTDGGTYDERSLPDNMRSWLESYTEQIRQLDVCLITQNMTSPATASRKAISPMLQSKWNQHEPYNNMCPTDPSTSKTSLAGCVAVAMAQVMYYYGYPSRTTATIPSYSTETAKISMPSIGKTYIKWGSILPTYGSNATSAQEEAVAELLLLCGSAVEMDYGSGSSTASSNLVVPAMRQYFGYDGAMQYVSRIGMNTNDWESLIYNELYEGRPIIYRGTRDAKGSDSGHAFVIDGYDGNGYYHLNWGWGNYNGFFLLSVLAPYVSVEKEMLLSNEGYCLSQKAVIGIKPDAGGSLPMCMTARAMELTSSSSVSRSSTSVNFPEVTVTTATYNKTGDTQRWDVGIGLMDKNGNLVATSTTKSDYELNDNYGWKTLNSKITFGSNLSNGVYRIVGISRISGQGLPWQLDENAKSYGLFAKIQGKNMTIRPVSVSLTGSLTLEEDAEVGKLARLKMHINNNGTDFNNVVYLFVDGNRAGGRYVDIAMDGSADMEIGFTPQSSGYHTLELAYYYDGDYTTFATLNAYANAAATNNLKISVTGTNATNDKKIGSTLELSLSIKNNNSAYYNDKIRASIYKLRHDGSNTGDIVERQEREFSIAPGSTVNTDFRFTDLEEGEYYFVWIEYFSDGAINKNDRTYGGGYTVSNTIGIREVLADDDIVNVFTLNGTMAGQCRRSQLTGWLKNMPKGVYVIEGKKVVLK